jgi:hypothetical protein
MSVAFHPGSSDEFGGVWDSSRWRNDDLGALDRVLRAFWMQKEIEGRRSSIYREFGIKSQRTWSPIDPIS